MGSIYPAEVRIHVSDLERLAARVRLIEQNFYPYYVTNSAVRKDRQNHRARRPDQPNARPIDRGRTGTAIWRATISLCGLVALKLACGSEVGRWPTYSVTSNFRIHSSPSESGLGPGEAECWPLGPQVVIQSLVTTDPSISGILAVVCHCEYRRSWLLPPDRPTRPAGRKSKRLIPVL